MSKVLLGVPLVIISFLLGYIFFHTDSCGADCQPDIKSISAQDFYTKSLLGEYHIIDIRTPQEFNSGHLSKADNQDFYQAESFNKYLDTLDKSKKYLIYCRSGNRTGKTLDLMRQKGFHTVYDLSGGLVAWQAAKLPLAN